MLTMDRFPVISTKEQLKSLVSDIGFLPFFSCGIPGFCLRDTVDSSVWFVKDVEGPWEWKTDVGIYGKLFRGKAVFMWWFCPRNWRNNQWQRPLARRGQFDLAAPPVPRQR